ncbi:lipopolysaccharide biosynthesis protein [Geodermatophilus sp. SYSU D01119]
MPGLRTRVIRGVGWTAVQRWVVRGTTFVTFVALSRLLTPEDIGVVALALAITTAFTVFVDLGMSDFLVRSDDSEEARTTSTVFWLQMGLATCIAVPLAVFAGPLSAAVGSPGLAPVLRVLCFLLPLYAAAAVPAALLHRHLSFAALAARDIAAAVAGGVVGVGSALLGAGVWSLVAQSYVHATVSLVTVLARTRWRPRFAVSSEVTGRVLRFGAPLVGVQVMQTLRDRADAFVIGGVAGAEALGLWTVAARLLSVVAEVSTSVMDTVALPVFSRVRDDAERFRTAHATAVAYSMALLTPALLVLLVTSPVLVPFFFGAQWTSAVPLAQVLCLAYAVSGLAYLNRPTLVARGKVGLEFALTGGGALLHVVVVSVAVSGGLTVVAWAAVGEAVIATAAGALVLRWSLGLRPPVPLRAFGTLAAGAAGGAAGLGVHLADLGRWTGLALSTTAAVAAFAVVMWVTNAALVRELSADARRLLPTRT